MPVGREGAMVTTGPTRAMVATGRTAHPVTLAYTMTLPLMINVCRCCMEAPILSENKALVLTLLAAAGNALYDYGAGETDELRAMMAGRDPYRPASPSEGSLQSAYRR